MMVGLSVVIAIAAGILWCVKHDLPHLYLRVRRVVFGLMTALALASTTTYIIISAISCNDVDRYSLLWYLLWCMDHSS
jgi:hypothetical protein